MHVDDGIALVSSAAMREYILGKLGAKWTIVSGEWKRTLGADVRRGDDWIEVSADALIDTLVKEHLLAEC